MRVVRAAVEGRPVRTGRQAGGVMAGSAPIDGPVGSAPTTARTSTPTRAFFEMSPASAEQVTMQIRSMMERAWEYIAIAYQGRAHIALGYASWDEYVDDRLGDLRLTVPREQRGAVGAVVVEGADVAAGDREGPGRQRRRPCTGTCAGGTSEALAEEKRFRSRCRVGTASSTASAERLRQPVLDLR